MWFRNLGLVFSLLGILKIATVIFGIVSVGLIGHAYESSAYNNLNKMDEKLCKFYSSKHDNLCKIESISKETFYLAVSVMWCTMSLAFLIRYLITEELQDTHGDKYFDMGFHILGGVLILAGSCVVFLSATNIDKIDKDYSIFRDRGGRLQYKSEKIASGAFGLVNGIIYCFTAGVIFFQKTRPS